MLCFCYIACGVSITLAEQPRTINKKLWVLLIQKDITKMTLRKDVGLSTGTMSKLNKSEEVALPVLMRLCDYLDCDIGDICEVLRDE